MIDKNPMIVNLSANCKAAISFSLALTVIQPGASWQRIITCVVRLLEGPKTTYAGVAVCSPRDHYDERIAQVVSLTRALAQVFPDIDQRELKRLARKTLRSIEIAETANVSPVMQVAEALSA